MAEGNSEPGTRSDLGESSPPESHPVINSIEENMKNLKSQLIEILDPDFGLLDKLLKRRALARQDEARVMSGLTIYDRNEKLLEFIFQKSKYDDLVLAMTETNQTHLVNFVKANGEYRPEFQLNWPLMEKERDILDDNQDTLLDVLDITDLINMLFSDKVLVSRQREFISAKLTGYEKNKAFLDILRRCSLAAYYKTMEFLDASNQSHVAKIFEKGGMAVQVSATQNLGSLDQELVDRLTSDILRTGQPLHLLAAVNLNVIAVRRGNSVVLYFLCETKNELTNLCEVMDDGRLKNVLETLFNQLIQNMEIRILVLKIYDGVIEKAKQSFERESARDKKYDVEISRLWKEGQYQFPEHVEDEGDESVEEPEEEMYVEEEDFDEENIEVATQKMEQLFGEETDPRKFGRQPARAYSEMERIRAILRNNSDYLMEYIRPNGSLISQLHITGCLTDDKMRLVKTLRSTSDRNDEILNAIQVNTYKAFIRCLRQNGQNLVADIVARGGAVLRLRIAFKDKSVPSIEKQIVEKINLLQDKSQVFHDEVKRMLSLLKIGNIELLNAQHEMGITVWLWCQSDPAFTRIIKMNQDGKLNELLLWLFNKLLNNEIPHEAEIEVDIGDMDMEFVCGSLPEANIRATLPSSELGTICSVTKLQSHIYVLCKKPSAIRVFDDLDFSKSSKTIPLNGMEPVDIAACSSTGSLYISDSDTFSIWKVTEMDHKVTKWLENISNPFTLSVTSSGEVVVVRRDKTCLEIYGPDAKKLYDISLPPGYVPNHAVKTSSGNFIVTCGKECDISNSIFELTRDGKLVKIGSFGYDPFTDLSDATNDYLIPKETMHQNFYLRYMSLDRHDRVYAADFHNGGVLQFDSQLMLCPKLPMFAGVQQTLRTCLIENDKLVMVVHGDPTKLDVYELDLY